MYSTKEWNFWALNFRDYNTISTVVFTFEQKSWVIFENVQIYQNRTIMRTAKSEGFFFCDKNYKFTIIVFWLLHYDNFLSPPSLPPLVYTSLGEILFIKRIIAKKQLFILSIKGNEHNNYSYLQYSPNYVCWKKTNGKKWEKWY